VQLITAQNAYDVAKAQLNQAMGVEGPIDYQIESPAANPVDGEDKNTDDLLPSAIKARPDLQALADQVKAQDTPSVRQRRLLSWVECHHGAE